MMLESKKWSYFLTAFAYKSFRHEHFKTRDLVEAGSRMT